MAEALEESGFEVMGETGDELADLLIVDVDSGLEEVELLQTSYTAEDRPVLVCGLRPSRESHAQDNWLERPFSPSSFIAQCRTLLGLNEAAQASGLDAAYPGLHEDSTPETQRLTLEDAEKLEEELGLEKGALSAPPKSEGQDDQDEFDAALMDTHDLNAEEGAEFLEIDTSSSIVLDVEDLEDVHEELAAGGSFIGEVERASVAEDEFDWEEPIVEAPEQLRSPTLSQTMPDAPAVMAPDSVLDEVSEESAFPEPPVDDVASSHGSVAQLPPQLERQIESVAKLLANSWGRIGLAARPRDRADHMRRVLRAIFSDGLSAAAAEVERIPGSRGFSGDLSSLDLEALLNTVRDRQLRGRLELSVGDDDYVLYLNGGGLDDIENLSGDDDALLLEILLEQGRIAHEVYERLAQSLNDELGAPILMQLREDQLVGADDLAHARRERAVRLIRRLSEARGGRFAFMDVDKGSGHAWPVDGISANVDALLDDAHLGGASEFADALDETFVPEGLEIDEQLPQTVEVPDPDEEL
jgi:hypothetical protein